MVRNLDEMKALKDSMNLARKDFEEIYEQLENDIKYEEEKCCCVECSNCNCGDEVVAECTIAEELTIEIVEDEFGHRMANLIDIEYGDCISVTQEQLDVITAMMEV